MPRRIVLFAVCFVFLSCSRTPTPSPRVTASPDRWVLLNAPALLPWDCNESSEPCTGTPYVRAPLSDWKQKGEYNSFRECAASIRSNEPDATSKDTDEDHKQGRLTKAERMLGFKCVPKSDSRLTSPPPYDWKKESLEQPSPS